MFLSFPDKTEACPAEYGTCVVCSAGCWPCSLICNIVFEKERLRWRPIEAESEAMNELRLLRVEEAGAGTLGSGPTLLAAVGASVAVDRVFSGLAFALAETGMTTPGAPSPRRVNLGVSSYVFCVSHIASPVGDVGGRDRKLVPDLGLVEWRESEVDVELGDTGGDEDEDNNDEGDGE